MLGAMATLPLPAPGPSASPSDVAALGETLFDKYHIEVPVLEMPALQGADADTATGLSPRFVRISAQRYNSLGQYADLADALVQILAV
jgi:hypothetical protein